MARKALGLAALTAASLGVLAGGVFAAYRRDIAAIRHRVRRGGRIAHTARGPIEYAVDGTGPPVLVIHGAGGGYDQGLLIAKGFGNHRVIAPSRFGYLGTPLPPDGSPAAQADAHAALLDSLELNSVIVAGASAGAPSAVELALRHPGRVRALILLVPRGYCPQAPVALPPTPSNLLVLRLVMSGGDFAYWAALRTVRRELVQFMGVPAHLEARAPAAERRRVDALLRSILPLSRRLAGIRNDADTLMQPLPLDRVTAPTCIVTARDDLFNTRPAAEYMAARIPGAKLVVLDSGGHLFVGRHHEVTGAIAEFLAGVAAVEAGAEPLRRPA